MSSPVKYVYAFSAALTEGEAAMKNLLGGKGANLAEMCRLGITVPPGFTISTEACTEFTDKGQAHVFELIRDEVAQGVARVESEMGKRFGDPADPLLLSVRSGARASMPGMMDTILNLGLNDEAVVGLARKANNERFAWDSYRRFIQMYGDVVMGLKPVSKEEHDPFEVIIDMLNRLEGSVRVVARTDVTVRVRRPGVLVTLVVTGANIPQRGSGPICERYYVAPSIWWKGERDRRRFTWSCRKSAIPLPLFMLV